LKYLFADIYFRKEGTKTLSVDLKWKRGKIYDREIASAFYLQAVDDEKGDYNPRGVVVRKNESETRKIRPFPLATVDLTKQGKLTKKIRNLKGFFLWLFFCLFMNEIRL